MKHRKTDNEFTIRTSKSPIMGYLCYSVFHNGVLIFTIDGDRISVFKEGQIELFNLPDYPKNNVYRIADMLFTGLLPLTANVLKVLPESSRIYSGLGHK